MSDPGRKPSWGINKAGANGPLDDQWMLELWTAREHHIMRQMVRTRLVSAGRGLKVEESDYQSVCSCGWRSIEFVRPTVEECPILSALLERQKRVPVKRDPEWQPL